MIADGYNSSWSSEGIIVSDKAIERHGGWKNWKNLSSIRLQPLNLSGVVPKLKGYSKTFTLPESFEIFPKERRVLFHEFPEKGKCGEFLKGNTQLFDSSNGHSILAEAHNARSTFEGFKKNRQWSHLDSLYFFGYAWTTYLNIPFILPGLKFLKKFKINEAGEVWDALRVEFPEDFDTHSRVQTFYFDRSGLLRRNDYCADIIGPWALGAHYSQDYTEINKIAVALKRRVFARLGTLVFPISALSADLRQS